MSGYCERCDELKSVLEATDDRIAALETQLTEANDKARLQRALDRIYDADAWSQIDIGNGVVMIESHDFGPTPFGCYDSIAEAAEKAAEWTESQKEGEHAKAGG